jgi:membrane protease YdiL (CAAX protease family)
MRAAFAFVLIYLAFDRLAAALGSTRGEWGLVVCAAVLALTLSAERWLTRAGFRDGLRALGLAAPAGRALAAAAALSVALLACVPLLARFAGVELALRDGAAWLALGMLAQGGVAEETLFRGFMYRHLRRTRTFWRAASLSAVPFAAAHVPLFFIFEPAVALLALGMAIAWSFPLAWVFDRAGGSIWPGALLHATIQGGIKLLVDDSDGYQTLAIAWLALGLAAPWLLFLLRSQPTGQLHHADRVDHDRVEVGP